MSDRKQEIMSEIRLRAAQAAGGGYDLDAYELVAADWIMKCQNALREAQQNGSCCPSCSADLFRELASDPDYGLTEK